MADQISFYLTLAVGCVLGGAVGSAVGRWLVVERLQSVLRQMRERGAVPYRWTAEAWCERVEADVVGRPARVRFDGGVWRFDAPEDCRG